MIRTNLSTRPFYNERIVHLWLLGIFAVAIAVTAFNVTRVIRYSHSDTELGTRATRDEERAEELRTSAARQRASVDPKQIEFASAEAREANDLIDRRTFSWTDLFNQFEKTLPDDVRITSMRPKAERGQFLLTIGVVARSADDVNRFFENLEATGTFTQVGSRIDEYVNERGLLEASLQALYTPARGRAGEGGRR